MVAAGKEILIFSAPDALNSILRQQKASYIGKVLGQLIQGLLNIGYWQLFFTKYGNPMFEITLYACMIRKLRLITD